MKLLLVDDESEALEGMEYYFTGRGHEVLIARGGYEALALIKACKPQLMLLDLKMKGLSGFDILKQVRELHVDLKTVVVTGMSEDNLEQECLRLGAFKVIHKPVRVEDLEEAIQAVKNDSR